MLLFGQRHASWDVVRWTGADCQLDKDRRAILDRKGAKSSDKKEAKKESGDVEMVE